MLVDAGILLESGTIAWNKIDLKNQLNSNILEGTPLGIYSQALQDALAKKRREAEAVLDTLDSHNFSVMVMLGLLTNPSDAKLDNFIAKTKKKKNAKPTSARGGSPAGPRRKLVSIDNEDSFIYSILSLSTGHLVGVRNILFCFPQMEKEIDSRARAWLASARPEIVLRDWLKDLMKKNRDYQQMVRSHMLTRDELRELNLPIKLVPGIAEQIHRKLRKMKEVVLSKKGQGLTLMNLLQQVDPILHRYYVKIKEGRHSDPLGMISHGMDLLFSRSSPMIEDILPPDQPVEVGAPPLKDILKQVPLFQDYVNDRTQLPEVILSL